MPLQLEIQKLLVNHSDRVKSIDLHTSEPWILTSLFSGKIYIWNYNSGDIVRQWDVSSVPIRTCKFVERKQWVVLGCDDLKIRVYNYNTAEKVTEFDAHSDYIRCIDIHPSEPLMLSCGDDMSIKLWNWEQGWKNTKSYEGHSHYVMQVKFNPKDNNTFASCSLDNSIKVWGLNSTSPYFSLSEHKMGVNCIDYSTASDKPYLISGSDDKTIRIWDYQTKTCIQTLDGHTENITSVLFHPKLPVIITGSEDGTVRIWHNITYKCEMTLNYGSGRVWCIQCADNSSKLGIGFDEGCTVVQLGSEAPVMSLDCNGHLMHCDNGDIRTAIIQNLQCVDEQAIDITYKDLGRSELFPQSLTYNNNGRFMLLCGDGEYSIYTTRVLRSKCYGSAIEAVWSADGNGDYATKETTTKVKLFTNFKETITVVTPFPVEKMFGGIMMGLRSSNFIVFYSWQSGDVVKKIDVTPNDVFWSEDGSLLVLTTSDGFFVLSVKESENGFEFDLLHELGDIVVSGSWFGSCFIYNTEKGIKYYVGGELIIVKHQSIRVHLLGYLDKENAIIVVDKDKNLTAIPLDQHLLRYQTAVLDNDFETANAILPNIGSRELEKLSLFLQGQGYLHEAIKVTNDPMRRLDLAIALQDVEQAMDILTQQGEDRESSKYWSQLGEICLQKGDMTSALTCIEKAKDYSTMLLLASCYSDSDLMSRVEILAREEKWGNVAFMAAFMTKNVQGCIDILTEEKRYPEAAFFANTYCPEKQKDAMMKWKDYVSGTETKLKE